ncbi:5-carboxymethyl-2-hydroxymuconate delta isomerase [Streptomyces noursei]|uniref:5-carboxymethyl-2-hydroxymuconate Delta-isomerase n=1 Tax=Streptomyces noursei TaxID=1971 RepID=UPI0030F368ED
MPHITVDYSAELAGVFDRHAFVRELHPMVLDVSGSAGVCKTFFRPASDTYVGDQKEGQPAFVHVAVGLLPGRSDELKGRLSEDVLALLGKHLPDVPGAPGRSGLPGLLGCPGGAAREVISSVEVRDLAGSYRLHHPPR